MSAPRIDMKPVVWALAITVAVVSVIGFAGHHFGLAGVLIAAYLMVAAVGTVLFLAAAHVGARSEGRS